MASKDETPAAPADPPSYIEATSTGATTSSHHTQATHLEVPDIPQARRKSMEDELRPLPEGWIRLFDKNENHQFFVDTKSDPPRSIWTHPLDDPEIVQSLSSEERERLQAEEADMRRPPTPLVFDEKHQTDTKTPLPAPSEPFPPELPSRPSQSGPAGSAQKKSLGERLKDKVTGMNHDERERYRAQRAEEDRRYYEAHLRFRSALRQAQITGQPQPLGKDAEGHEVFLLPPPQGAYGYGGFQSGYGGQRYMPPNPAYQNPNARFISPPGFGYNRGYGPGYGRGYGPGGLALPVLGGLAGGALLGGLLF